MMARQRKGNPVHGWIVIDKSEDVTSTQVVGRVRRLFNAQKAGHGGTLDPLAVGILPIALGEATKTVRHLVAAEKKYRFTIRWGEQTETDDREGAVVATSDWRPSDAAIEEMLPRFVGDIVQVPPVYSAIKVAGQRAYDRARRGEAVELEPRTVSIFEARLVARPDPDHGVFEMACGKGVYVRALARDLALALGTVGHVAALKRTQLGPFTENDAISLDKLEELGHSGAAFEHLKPVETALDDIPALAITGMEALRLRQGQSVTLTRPQINQMCGEPIAYAAVGSQAVALGEIRNGQFHPTRVFNLPMKGKIDVDYS